MNMKTTVRLNIRDTEVKKEVTEASKKAMRDTVVEVTRDAV